MTTDYSLRRDRSCEIAISHLEPSASAPGKHGSRRRLRKPIPRSLGHRANKGRVIFQNADRRPERARKPRTNRKPRQNIPLAIMPRLSATPRHSPRVNAHFGHYQHPYFQRSQTRRSSGGAYNTTGHLSWRPRVHPPAKQYTERREPYVVLTAKLAIAAALILAAFGLFTASVNAHDPNGGISVRLACRPPRVGPQLCLSNVEIRPTN